MAEKAQSHVQVGFVSRAALHDQPATQCPAAASRQLRWRIWRRQSRVHVRSDVKKHAKTLNTPSLCHDEDMVRPGRLAARQPGFGNRRLKALQDASHRGLKQKEVDCIVHDCSTARPRPGDKLLHVFFCRFVEAMTTQTD